MLIPIGEKETSEEDSVVLLEKRALGKRLRRKGLKKWEEKRVMKQL